MARGIHAVRRLEQSRGSAVCWEMSPGDARDLADFLELEDGKGSAQDIQLLRAAADILDPPKENDDA